MWKKIKIPQEQGKKQKEFTVSGILSLIYLVHLLQ